MVVCSFYTCSLPAYYVVDTTFNPKGYRVRHSAYPQFFCFLNNPGSLFHVLKVLFRFRANIMDFSYVDEKNQIFSKRLQSTFCFLLVWYDFY